MLPNNSNSGLTSSDKRSGCCSLWEEKCNLLKRGTGTLYRNLSLYYACRRRKHASCSPASAVYCNAILYDRAAFFTKGCITLSITIWRTHCTCLRFYDPLSLKVTSEDLGRHGGAGFIFLFFSCDSYVFWVYLHRVQCRA